MVEKRRVPIVSDRGETLRRRIAAVTADPICEELKVRGSTRRARSASKAFDLNKGVGKMKYAFLSLGVLVSATAAHSKRGRRRRLRGRRGSRWVRRPSWRGQCPSPSWVGAMHFRQWR